MKKQICLFLVNPIRLSDKHRIFQITGIGGKVGGVGRD